MEDDLCVMEDDDDVLDHGPAGSGAGHCQGTAVSSAEDDRLYFWKTTLGCGERCSI